MENYRYDIRLDGDQIELLREGRDWPIADLIDCFADRSNVPQILVTDKEKELWQRRRMDGIPKCAAAINGLLRGLTVSKYIRLVVEARIV